MIKKVDTKKDLFRFIHFVEQLYKGETHYIFPLFHLLKKELTKEVLDKKNYTALMSLDGKKLNGRLLYTFDYSKHKQDKIGYFSFFDSIYDIAVVKELFDFMEEDMRNNGITYSEGTYTPYDPDTRRGVLVTGFDIDPTLFTAYNYEYYGSLLEQYGYEKVYDTHSLGIVMTSKTIQLTSSLNTNFQNRHDVRVDSLNLKNLNRDIDDIHKVLEIASTEINYQDPPSINVVRDVAKNMKMFIEPEYIKIARENATSEPVGFCLVLPDYNQVFKKTKGRIRPLTFLLEKRKITKARGLMQYVIPKYQNTGLIGSMYHSIYKHFDNNGITDFEAGTMMEDNLKALNSFNKFGGKIIKTYRIYGKEISQ